jgi:hypothetical protein
MTPKQRTRVAWLVVERNGLVLDAASTNNIAMFRRDQINLARQQVGGTAGAEIIRITYPWPVRTRAKK